LPSKTFGLTIAMGLPEKSTFHYFGKLMRILVGILADNLHFCKKM
jgi:hypothetical protein